MERADEITPIDRPLLRSDIDDVRVIVRQISERQLEFIDGMKALARRLDATEQRTEAIERKLWLPALVSIVAAALAVLARIVP